MARYASSVIRFFVFVFLPILIMLLEFIRGLQRAVGSGGRTVYALDHSCHYRLSEPPGCLGSERLWRVGNGWVHLRGLGVLESQSSLLCGPSVDHTGVSFPLWVLAAPWGLWAVGRAWRFSLRELSFLCHFPSCGKFSCTHLSSFFSTPQDLLSIISLLGLPFPNRTES